MRLDYYHVDSFTAQRFRGNPAGVCVIDGEWLPAATMQSIAAENGLAETAFIRQSGDHFDIRWFTPDIEMDLCGHATLASAYVIKRFIDRGIDAVAFDSKSGVLRVSYEGDLISMDLPKRTPVKAELPADIFASLSAKPSEVLKARDYVLVYPDEDEIADLQIRRELLDRVDLGPGGVCVTAPGGEFDFVSRFFTPRSTILEDPVTGSAHCSLIPFWAERLGKRKMRARQLSARTGILHCENGEGERVSVAGNACLYSRGTIELEG